MNEEMNYYMNEIGRIPLLTVNEEKELLEKAVNGDKTARNKLVSANLRFVIKTASKFKGYGFPLEDLVAEGNLGLIKAIEKFDLTKNVRFTTYAVFWIREAITAAIRDRGSAIRLPRNRSKEAGKGKWAVASLDVLVDEESESTLGDLIPDRRYASPEESFFIEQDRKTVDELLSTLNEKERVVINMRFGLDNKEPLSLREAGEILDCTREGVRQIEQRALKKMRSANEDLVA